MILYGENLKYSTKKFLEVTNNYSNVGRLNIIIKLKAFLYINNVQVKSETVIYTGTLKYELQLFPLIYGNILQEPQ